MLMHHTLESAKSRSNSESDWLLNGSFLLTESFVKIICLVWQVCDAPCEPFLSGATYAYFGAPCGAPCTPVEEFWG